MRFAKHLWCNNKMAFAGLLIVVSFFILGVFGPWIAPYHYNAQDYTIINQPPSLAYPLGTDELGRDVLSRIMWGARTALFVVVATHMFSLPLAFILGMLAGYFGKWIDSLIMRIADLVAAFPGLLFMFFIAATIRPVVDQWARGIAFLKPMAKAGHLDYLVIVIALAAVGWAALSRFIRGEFFRIKGEDYIEAAKAAGATHARIIFKHMLPNALPNIIVLLSMSAGTVILLEATLSLFGIGIRPPNASWGAMIIDNYAYWRTRPHMVISPGLVLAAVIFAFNFLGDGLNDYLNPKTRRSTGAKQ